MVTLPWEITSIIGDVTFVVSLWFDATTSSERPALLRSMERAEVDSDSDSNDVPAAGMAEASAEMIAREGRRSKECIFAVRNCEHWTRAERV